MTEIYGGAWRREEKRIYQIPQRCNYRNGNLWRREYVTNVRESSIPNAFAVQIPVNELNTSSVLIVVHAWNSNNTIFKLQTRIHYRKFA